MEQAETAHSDQSASGDYYRPASLAAALEILGGGGDLRVIAGGTDHFPARVGPAVAENLLDISAISDLGKIDHRADVLRIGALVTWSDILKAELPPAFDGLKSAASQVGGVQIQNRGTVAGNLCNASPAADGIPPLLALRARVVLDGPAGERVLPLSDFITGYRTTARDATELVTAIDVPMPDSMARGGFLKLGARHYLVISIAMVAGVLTPTSDGRVGAVEIAVGACSAVAQRLVSLEQALIGARLDQPLAGYFRAEHFADLAPIDDPRATADYRREAAQVLVARLLTQLQGSIGGDAQ